MTSMSIVLGGSLTALATPFRDGAIDESAFMSLCKRQIARGTTALVVCGSTGEAAALHPKEQAALIRLAVETAARQVPVIAGCGGLSTDTAAKAARSAAECGAAALLYAPTPYVKPSQEGIITHMRVLAHVSGLPLILYDIPGRVGVPINDGTVATLFDRGLAIGFKAATADLGRPARLRSLCGPGLVQLSGDDEPPPHIGRLEDRAASRSQPISHRRFVRRCISPGTGAIVLHLNIPGIFWHRCMTHCSPRATRFRSRQRWR